MSTNLKCTSSIDGCKCKVTYIDIKGFIYCDEHGKQRKAYMRARKLTSKELKQLSEGKPLDRY